MPTVTLNRREVEKLLGKKISVEQLKDRISMLGTDLESVTEEEIVVEIFPNRPDMLSEQGFARALSSFLGFRTGLRKYHAHPPEFQVIITPAVKEVRPFTACAIVKNIQLHEERVKEIIHLQEKLHVTYGRNRKKCALGIYPLEKITFPITYTADLPENIRFQPLETERTMNGREILAFHPKGKEYAHLLQGAKMYPYFHDARNEILSLPPIINSQQTGRVTEETKDLFIECSGFDFATLSTCLNIMVSALADQGGEIHQVEIVSGKEKKVTPHLIPRRMPLDLSYVNHRLGLELKELEAMTLLEKMGYGYDQGQVLIPPYRADILHQADLMEDLAIAYGYENFEEKIPNVATIGAEAEGEKFSRKLREIGAGLEFLEVKNVHLLTREELQEKMNRSAPVIPLKNALGEHNHLRNSLLPSLLKNLAENQQNEYPQLLLEIGRIFTPGTSPTGVQETEQLAFAVAHEKADFTEARQIAEVFLKALGLSSACTETQDSSFLPGRAAEIRVGKEKIGIVGEIHPQVLSNWGMVMPVVVGQLEIEKLRILCIKSN